MTTERQISFSILETVRKNRWVNVCLVWPWGAKSISTCTNVWISFVMGDWATKKCASLNDISLTRLFQLQKQKLIHPFNDKTGLSYNMHDPIQEKQKN